MEKTENNFFDNAQEQAYLNVLAEQAKILEAEREEHRKNYFQYLDYMKERGVIEYD